MSIPKKNYYLALDIGGTKIFWALCNLDSKQPKQKSILYQDQCQTPKGLSHLKEALHSVINQAQTWAIELNLTLISHIYIATPGKLIGPKKTIIAPGSAQNLEQFNGEFDQLDLEALALSVLPKGWMVTIKNDAIAQMTGGIRMLNLENKISPIKLGYIGPGTGLGGGFCTLKPTGELDFYTDGHIYDIQLTTTHGKLVRAEDVISGRAFMSQTGIDPKTVCANPELLKKWTPVILTMGNLLGQLTERLHKGPLTKDIAAHDWTAEEKKQVQGTTDFIIGGSLGTQDPFASILLNQAHIYLQENALDFVHYHRIPHSGLAALFGLIDSSV